MRDEQLAEDFKKFTLILKSNRLYATIGLSSERRQICYERNLRYGGELKSNVFCCLDVNTINVFKIEKVN